ncbi:MAG: sulfotransferase [Actinomycetota bacterium]|nr:sulfotransferase [Actinomycetota bacterium]
MPKRSPFEPAVAHDVDLAELAEIASLRGAERRSLETAVSGLPAAVRRIRPITLAKMLDANGAPEAAARLFGLVAADRLVRLVVPGEPGAGVPDDVVLIAGTPRTGNSIFRRLVAHLGYTDCAVHAVGDLDWSRLPSRSVVQVHATPSVLAEPSLVAVRPRVVSLSRHPLDVLQSIRAFASVEPESLYWLEGNAIDDPAGLADLDRWTEWAVSPGAARLLALTVEWAALASSDDRVEMVQYRDLVDQPAAVLNRVAAFLGVSPLADVPGVMQRETEMLPRHHITWGGPGAHRQLDRRRASRLRRAHRDVFKRLGYS